MFADLGEFYLTAAQCEIVNAELERIHSVPQKLGDIRPVMDPFSVHPAMNDTYYLPEIRE